jgi:SPP1 family predicted phage head-tail adaptor
MLSSRLQVYAKSESVNSYGESELTTSLYKSIWAQEMEIKMDEVKDSESVKSMDAYKFKTRFNSWLDENYEIQYDDGRLTIESVEPAGHQLRQWLIVKAIRQQ